VRSSLIEQFDVFLIGVFLRFRFGLEKLSGAAGTDNLPFAADGPRARSDFKLGSH
jgi:hypothetical protein